MDIMIRYKILFSALLILIVLLSPVSALGVLKVTVVPKNPTAGEKVKIIVTTAMTNKPVAGAKVYVKSSGLGKILIGETNSNGELIWIFEEPGIYRIGVEKEGYISIPVESGEIIVVKPKGILKLNVTKDKVVKEQGKVKVIINIYVTANGVPVEGAEVYINGKFIGLTDSNGLLTYKLEPGVYVIKAKKTGYLPSFEFTLNIKEEELRKKIEEVKEKVRKKIYPIVLMKNIHPEYFVIGDDESYKVSAIICDEKGLKSAKLLYSTDGINWKEAESSIISSSLKFNISDLKVYKIEGIIPPQKAGTVIFYKFVAEDEDGNKAESPTGMYFVVNDESNLKIMIVDPWIKLWLLKLNAKKYSNIIENITTYKIKTKWLKQLIDDIKCKYNEVKRINTSDLIKRHYWEKIGKYNFIIVEPNEIEEALSFKPKVIILSNLLLSRWVVPHELIEYMRENNAGLIATHGTIFDQVLWIGDTREEAIEVGAREHVGDRLDVYIDETIALLLGLKLSPLIECARDRVAEILCKSGDPRIRMAGKVLGSTPLHPAYIPFSGKIIVKEEHEIVEGLDKEFQVNIPSLYKKKFKAYTTFGWQYVLPSESIRIVKERAKIVKEQAKEIYHELSNFIATYTGFKVDRNLVTDGLLYSLDSKLLDSAINLWMEDRKIKMIIENQDVEFDNEKIRSTIKLLEKYKPVKVIAISDDYLAGIIVHDEWFRKDGIRAVYITFEAEASKDDIVWKLIDNCIIWSSKFEYKIQEVKEITKEIKPIKKITPTIETQENVEIPGFETIFGIIALTFALRTLRR